MLREGVDRHLTGSTTLSKLVKDWVIYKENIKPLSRGMQHSVRAILMAKFATKVITQITAQDLTQWGTELGKTLAPATVMHHFMVLRTIYQSANSLAGFTADLTPINHAMDMLKRVRVVAKSQSRDRRVTDDELLQIVTYLKGKFLAVPTDIFVRLAVVLPRRREELLTMTWSNYTGEELTLLDTKNPQHYRKEIIPVPPAARAIIDALPRADGEDRILPFKPESVSAAFQRAVRALGLADIRLHDLRHEGISRLFEQGLQIQEVALISGHVSWTALKRYTHLKPSDVLEKLNAGRQRQTKTTTEPQ